MNRARDEAFVEIEKYIEKMDEVVADCEDCEKKSGCDDCPTFKNIDIVTDELIKKSEDWSGKKKGLVAAYFGKMLEKLDSL